jgi:hypothetical protein
MKLLKLEVMPELAYQPHMKGYVHSFKESAKGNLVLSLMEPV